MTLIVDEFTFHGHALRTYIWSSCPSGLIVYLCAECLHIVAPNPGDLECFGYGRGSSQQSPHRICTFCRDRHTAHCRQ